MKIGIITHDLSLFSNGLGQNAYFIYRVYEKLGHTCVLLSHNPNHKEIGYNNITVSHISDDESIFNVREYNLIITVAAGITQTVYDRCKTHNVYVVGFVCGNLLAMDLQGFTEDGKKCSVIGKERPVDELWIIGEYDFMKTYLELLRGTKAYLVPHLWSPVLIQDIATRRYNETIEQLLYDPKIHTNLKVDILILEPNLLFTKTALIPIMAAEKLYLTNKDLINEVFVFNFRTESSACNAIVNNLTIKDKVRRFKSLNIAEILLHFNKKDTIPIIVSHQIFNPWNYLYYELMYYGFPLVHNSPSFPELGYSYKEFDIDECAKQIEYAAKYHNRLMPAQLEKNREFLKTIDPEGEESLRIWKNLLPTSSTKSS